MAFTFPTGPPSAISNPGLTIPDSALWTPSSFNESFRSLLYPHYNISTVVLIEAGNPPQLSTKPLPEHNFVPDTEHSFREAATSQPCRQLTEPWEATSAFHIAGMWLHPTTQPPARAAFII